jgi:hypothetical protein
MGQPREEHISRAGSVVRPSQLFVRHKNVTPVGTFQSLSKAPGPPGFSFDVASDSGKAFCRSISSTVSCGVMTTRTNASTEHHSLIPKWGTHRQQSLAESLKWAPYVRHIELELLTH